MDVKLQTFLIAARMKSFTRAGEFLNLTQPAVSQHIRQLEEQYGVRLFIKKGRKLYLTPEGVILLRHATDISRMYRIMETELHNAHHAVQKYIVGATMTLGGYVIPPILAGYSSMYPRHKVDMRMGNTEEILQKLLQREIDMGFVEGPFDKKRFLHIFFRKDELVLAAAPQNPMAAKDAVDIEEVLHSRLILREKGSGTRKVLEETLLELGRPSEALQPYMEIGSIDAIKALVQQNVGCTIISREAIRHEVEQKTICIIPIVSVRIMREFNFVYLSDSPADFVQSFSSYGIQHFQQV